MKLGKKQRTTVVNFHECWPSFQALLSSLNKQKQGSGWFNVLSLIVTSNKCPGRQAKQVLILSGYAVPAFSSSTPEILFNKPSQSSFSSTDLWNCFWDSCESPATKMSYGLCSLLVIYTKRSLPCFEASLGASLGRWEKAWKPWSRNMMCF